MGRRPGRGSLSLESLLCGLLDREIDSFLEHSHVF
jgi:hypothetical protein